MSDKRRYFGTDGVRGKVGQYPITPDFVLKLGWAAGRVLAKQGTKKVIIGKDTRISGYMLESALEAGLAAAGLKATFTGPMPTPAVPILPKRFVQKRGLLFLHRTTLTTITALSSSLMKEPNCRMTLS